MASVGGMSLSTLRDGSAAGSAASFNLFKAPRNDHCRVFAGDRWEAEMRGGLNLVVFRSKHAITKDELLDKAIESTHRFLDFISVTARAHLLTKMAPDVNLLMFSRNDLVVIQHRDIMDFGVAVSPHIEVRNAQGNIKGSPPPPEPQWLPAFRYYRISQTTNDLVEAYRNLYLAFESVLAHICSKARREGERRWLERGLTKLGTIVDLSKYCPPGHDPIRSIVDTQYEAIRCGLFHAKPGRSILPHELPSHSIVSPAYEQLVQLWEDVARAHLSVQPPSGGLSYAGFKLVCDNFLPNLRMWLTTDDSPFNKEDIEISPRGLPCHSFATHQYLGEQRPGRAALLASIPVASLSGDQVVGRIAGTIDGTSGTCSHISGGLTLEGANEFVTIQVSRLVNPQAPKSVFN
jgi:hypothetical protein